jgi:LysM repeat protein
MLREFYIRFMVWLGAAPPSGYEYLLGEEWTKPIQYTLKEGETIFSVARRYGVHYERIAEASNIKEPSSVKPPQTITIPPPGWQPTQKAEAEPKLPPEPEVKPAPLPVEAPEPIISPEVREPEKPADIAPPQEELLEEAPPVPLGRAEPVGEEMVFRYEVQRGDTLSSVARRYGITVKDLVEANEEVTDPNVIFPGQKLIIPGYMSPRPKAEPTPPAAPPPPADGHFVYTIVSGDTLGAIAKRYGITVRALIEANNIEDPNLIHVGQRLIIPGVVKPPEPTPKPAPPQPTDPTFLPAGPPDAIRGIYVSYFAIGHPETRQLIFELLETTELNSIVIDAKGDYGWITYPTQVPLAREIGAVRPTIKDFQELMNQLKMRNVYTIARIVTFKDTPLAKSYGELAIKTTSGDIWQDQEESNWCDPLLKATWDYNIQIAVEAARLGFDEVMFDALRFPTPSQVGAPQFSQNVTRETRVAAITGFLSIARGQLNPLGVKVGARTVGYACWRQDDSLVGQDIERMAPYLDVLCPMLCPSTLGNGIPGYELAVAHPYEVVYESALRAANRVKKLSGCAIRPWIQDFQDYRFDKRVYGRAEIQAQIRACFDAGGDGFLVWNPQVKYTRQAYAPMAVAVTL